MFAELIFIVLLALAFRSRWQRRHLIKLASQLKSSFRRLPFIGHSYLLIGGQEHRMKTLQSFGRDAIKHGGTIAIWHASELFILVADPVVAECLLKHCLEKGDLMKLMHPVIGNGSIFAPVPIWRPRRKVLAPTFSPRNLAMFTDVFIRQSDIMMNNMRQAADQGTFSIWNFISTCTMNSVCESTLGVKLENQENCDHPFLKAIDLLTHVAAYRICLPWLHSDFIFTKTPHFTRVMQEKAVVHDLIDKVIKEKRDENPGVDNKTSDASENCLKTFLDMLMQSSDGNGGYTDVELKEETLVIVIAGTDTSAVGIGFALLMLSRHPDIQEKVYQELKEVFGDSKRKIENQDLQKLVYLNAVIKETLRMYPPVPVILRKVEKDVQLPTGVTLVEGCTVLIHIWAIHRNPQYWGENADEYRPERFIGATLNHPVAFLPFSHGPRGCLGYQYAMMSMTIALATLLRQYRVLPPAGSKTSSNTLRLKFDIMMRDADGYLVQLESRN